MKITKRIAECYNCREMYTFPDTILAWKWAENHQAKTGHSVSVPRDNISRLE